MASTSTSSTTTTTSSSKVEDVNGSASVISFLAHVCKVEPTAETGRAGYHAIIQKSPTHAYLLGEDDSQRKSVDEFLNQIEKDFVGNTDKQVQALHKLNKSLLHVYLVLNHVTLADIVTFVHLYPIVSTWTEKEKVLFYNITRWFNHIQHLKGLQYSALPIISLPCDAPEEPAAPAKAAKPAAGDAKKPAAAAAAAAGDAKPAAPQAEGKGKGKGKAEGAESAGKPAAEGDKPEGKNKGKPAAKQAAKPAAAVDRPEDVSRLDIRVGKIVNCKKHEGADSLYVEEIDVGEDAPRVVVSGLVKFVPLDEMQNRMVLVLCNLKPSNLKGIKSHAMVLAASNADHTHVELIDPPSSSKPGERVTFAGYLGEPDKVLKIEVFGTVAADLKTNEDKIATYKGIPFTTSAGVCSSKTITLGGIR